MCCTFYYSFINLGTQSTFKLYLPFSADQETQVLKEHLIDELDYVLVPTKAWTKLVGWYGSLGGQRPIVRKVRSVGHTPAWLLSSGRVF